ncbi:unnamed protein product, partial [Nesidiocoris tenuis]
MYKNRALLILPIQKKRDGKSEGGKVWRENFNSSRKKLAIILILTINVNLMIQIFTLVLITMMINLVIHTTFTDQ